jgi:hypothetical protein
MSASSTNSSVETFHSADETHPPSPTVDDPRETYCVWEQPASSGVPHTSEPIAAYSTINQLRVRSCALRGQHNPTDTLNNLWLPDAIITMDQAMIHREQDLRTLPPWCKRLL